MTVKIITDSTSYIDEKTRQDLDITRVNLSVSFPDETFEETKVAYDYFYQKIEKDKVIPSSSQPSLGQIYDSFLEIAARGEEVLGIFLSSKMSGTYESALIARQQVLEKFPRACIEVFDSKTNSMAMGIQVIEAALAAQSGKKMAEVKEVAHHIRERIHFYFVPASLEYLIKGGRIGGAAALIGSMLRIRPILYVNDGMTDVYERIRGTRRAIQRMLDILHEDARKNGLKHLLVHHINDDRRGRELAEHLSRHYKRPVLSFPIGPVIGLHVGPGTVGIVYCTKN
jgi:DegV family protein with EDD domain